MIFVRRATVLLFSCAVACSTTAAVTHTIDGTLPDGGDCSLFGSWDPATNSCRIEDARVEEGNWLRIESATVLVAGVLTNEAGGSIVFEWFVENNSPLINRGHIDVLGSVVNITDRRIENHGSMAIAPTGHLTNGGLFVHLGSIDNAGLLDNDTDLIEHCESVFTGNPVEGQQPTGAQSLYLGSSALEWCPVEQATGYDVVAGDLGLLLSSGGDFSAATTACLGNDLATLFLEHAFDPPAGQGLWSLVRANGVASAGYDTVFSSQVGSRSEEIAASSGACP